MKLSELPKKEKDAYERFCSFVGKATLLGYLTKEEIPEYIKRFKEILSFLESKNFELARENMGDLVMKIQMKRMVDF